MKTVTVELTLLADNTASPPFLAEHGFSVLLQVAEEGSGHVRTLLLDTGREVLFGNAELCGFDLSAVTDVALSHGHYDHTDALPLFLERYPETTVHASVGIFREHYSMSGGSCRIVALSAAARNALAKLDGQRLHLYSGTAEIAGGLVNLAEHIPQEHPLEIPSKFLFADPACLIPDTVPDEQVLWMRTKTGLVIVTGCCHAGFVNTCEHVRSLCPGVPLRAVIGGFHLGEAGSARLDSVCEYIRLHDIKTVVPCHCTGEAAIEHFHTALGGIVKAGGSGMRFAF